MNQLIQYRAEKDEFFETHPQSPLTPEQKNIFEGLHYFDENSQLQLTVEVEEFDEKNEVQIQTNTGDVQTYERFGRFSFAVEGEEVSLTIFRNEHGFFLPFADALAGSDTYGAGRYLEPEELGDGEFLVDFNLAYNPYCAYNESWSCPITPPENRLKVPIQAGEKVYHES
jgi:uncharacterized protein (DUF1684 family)